MRREKYQKQHDLDRIRDPYRTISNNPEQLTQNISQNKAKAIKRSQTNYFNKFSSIPLISPKNNSPKNESFSGFAVYQQEKTMRRSFMSKSNQVQQSMMELTRKKSMTDKLAKLKKQELIRALWKKMQNQKKNQEKIQREIARKQNLLRKQNQNSTSRFTNIQKKYQSKKSWMNRNKNQADTHKQLMNQTFHLQTMKREQSQKSLKQRANFIKVTTKSRIKFSRENKFQEISRKSNSVKLELKDIYHKQVQGQIERIQTMEIKKQQLTVDITEKMRDVQTFNNLHQNISKMRSQQLYQILLEKNRQKKSSKYEKSKAKDNTKDKSQTLQIKQGNSRSKLGLSAEKFESNAGSRTSRQIGSKISHNINKQKTFQF